MKITLNLALLLVIACACNKPGPKPVEKAKNALAAEKAQDYIQRYKRMVMDTTASGREWRSKNLKLVQGFTISSADLLQAMGRSPNDSVTFKHVRLYVGIDNLLNLRSFLTPVVGADIDNRIVGRDTILSGPYASSAWFPNDSNQVAQNDVSGPYVFDFTMPCPNSCNDDSPLLRPIERQKDNGN